MLSSPTVSYFSPSPVHSPLPYKFATFITFIVCGQPTEFGQSHLCDYGFGAILSTGFWSAHCVHT